MRLEYTENDDLQNKDWRAERRGQKYNSAQIHDPCRLRTYPLEQSLIGQLAQAWTRQVPDLWSWNWPHI